MTDHRTEEVCVVPVIQEQLQVDREAVETGRAVRLRKQVHEEPVEVCHDVTHDVIETRRVPVGRVIDAPVGIRHEGDVTIVPVVAERVVTHTELVLVEEIHIRRRSELRHERGQVNLRRESISIERFDPDTQEWRAEEEG
jgi:stress response protein YsnF